MFHYIVKDFQYMLAKQKLLLILVVCVQIVSTIVIYFAYGAVNHYNTQVGVMESRSTSYEFHVKDYDDLLTISDTNKFFDIVLSSLSSKVEFCYVQGYDDSGNKVLTHFGYDEEEGKYTFPFNILKSLQNQLDDKHPRFNSSATEIAQKLVAGENVAVVGCDVLPKEDTIFLGEEEYTIVGVTNMPAHSVIRVAYQCLPQNLKASFVAVKFSKPLLESEYETLYWAAKINFGNKVSIPDFNGVRNENQYRVYRNIMTILAIFMVMCTVNYCVIYNHLLEKRRRMFAVSRICGCTQFKSILVYMTELLSISFVTLGLGLVIFIKIVMPRARSIFEYMEYYFNMETYLRITLTFVGVLVIMYLILVLRYVHKTPVRLMKED